MRLFSPSFVIFVMLHIGLAVPRSASAQGPWIPAPDRDDRYGPNRIALDIGVLGAALAYSRHIRENTELGVALSGGAQTGFMLGSGELTGDRATPLFAELLSGAFFIRRHVRSRTELEAGVRVGWLYHPTEYETTFSGVYAAIQHRVGPLWIGPRLYLGRLSEESGRTQVSAAIVPVTMGFRWTW